MFEYIVPVSDSVSPKILWNFYSLGRRKEPNQIRKLVPSFQRPLGNLIS